MKPFWILGFASLLLFFACGVPQTYAPQTTPMPQSPWGGRYQYSYDLPGPTAPAGSIPVTIIVVDPHYRDPESVFSDTEYAKIGKGMSGSMGADMDKIIIAKGMTSKGPIGNLDEITYSDKKGADLTLVPRLFISTGTTYLDDWTPVNTGTEALRMERRFNIKVGGYVSFVMQEPLTDEKMWIKKLELEEIVVSGFECAEAIPQYTETKGLFGETTGKYISGYDTGQILYDGKLDAVANAMKRIYPTVLSKLWTYMDTDELQVLKQKVQEIRALKVYL